jgi:hypothetical protein
MILVLWTNDDIAEVRWLLVSSCKPSIWKRASAFFFHFAASPAPAAIPTVFPPKVTFLGPLAGLVAGMASLAEVSAILLAFGAEVEEAITSQDFIKFWGKFIAFDLLVLIENSQGFKTFELFKSSILETISKLPIIS